MFKFIQDNWDSIVLIGSLVLNLLGVSGKVAPIGTPKGFAKLESWDQKDGLPPTKRNR